jgi:peptidoglycan/xylan/chitin deacetylase (PgdA/CDA1 family)
LNYLKANNFQVMTLAEAIKYLQSDGDIKKSAVITVDDGYKSFIKNGMPLLKKYDMPATLFINTETVGGGDYMDWNELQMAIDNKIEIGNHTHSHAYFLNESDPTRLITFKNEIELSQSIILKNLKVTPKVFSYPYGEFNSGMKSLVKEMGFITAVAQNSGVIYSGSDLYQCPRFPMSELYASIDKFKEKVNMKSLKIISKTPEDSKMPANKQPLLTLTFKPTDLRLDQIQCFIQGSKCELTTIKKDETEVTVSLKTTTKLTGRRRTLYTVTVPDKNGKWHWFSHLWVDGVVKE